MGRKRVDDWRRSRDVAQSERPCAHGVRGPIARETSSSSSTPADIARSYDCNGSAAQKWVIARGSGAVKPSGHTNLCLDAGTSE